VIDWMKLDSMLPPPDVTRLMDNPAETQPLVWSVVYDYVAALCEAVVDLRGPDASAGDVLGRVVESSAGDRFLAKTADAVGQLELINKFGPILLVEDFAKLVRSCQTVVRLSECADAVRRAHSIMRN
jgi:hypothetical protein